MAKVGVKGLNILHSVTSYLQLLALYLCVTKFTDVKPYNVHSLQLTEHRIYLLRLLNFIIK